MLTLRPQPPPTRPPDHIMFQRRGRSRQVSHTALARQASEERQTVDHNQGRLFLRAAGELPAEHTQAERRRAPHDEKFGFLLGIIQVPQSVEDASLTPMLIPEPGSATPRSTHLVLSESEFPAAALPSPSPPSPSSPSLDYYDSPPSPPQSLVDQVHVAYALDNIHLAKILLLKLKGIEVTSDDDPRIAAVQDEDFDFCFVPNGRLMDEADEKALLEQQRKEIEIIQERRRAERLRACEQIWEQEKRRLRDMRVLALKRKEVEEKRVLEQQSQARIFKEREEAAEAERRARYRIPTIALTGNPARDLVSYDALCRSRAGSSHPTSPSLSSSPALSSRSEEPFVYDFMITPRRSPPARTSPLSRSSQSLSSQSISRTFTRPTYDESRCIPFADVLASMQGPLFPAEPRPTSPMHSKPTSLRKRKTELFDCLLAAVEWNEDERRQRKGKAPERHHPQRRNSDKSIYSPPCAACSIASTISPVPSSSSSRQSSRRSWLSFSSSSSASTAATTPSTSPLHGWFGKPISRSPALIATCLQTRPTSLLLPPISLPQVQLHSCKPRCRLTSIPTSEGPLPVPSPRGHSYNVPLGSPSSHNRSPSKKERSTTPPGSRVMRRVSQFVELAKGFQTAYMNPTLFSVSASSGSFEDRDIHAPFIVSASEGWNTRKDILQPSRRTSNPVGYRAHVTDVRFFLAESSVPTDVPPSSLSSLIPLRPRHHPSTEAPRTILPDPLPYPIVFKPLSVPPRSPFRLHAHIQPAQHAPWQSPPHDPTPAPWAQCDYNSQVTLRVRTVENPMYLRLKALQKIMMDRGSRGQGRPREGSLGAGKEKVLKVAFEGVGRSCLAVGNLQGQGRDW